MTTASLFVVIGVLFVFFVGMIGPATADISSVQPGSAKVAPGSAVSVTVTTDQGQVSVAPGGPSFIVVGPASRVAPGPNALFTFTVYSSATPGTYTYSFTDGLERRSFSLTVTAPPPTTTTTTEPPTTTTTTQPPTTTTTTEPPTTTTTTEPPTTTTTTEPPTTTTTTEPPTTTTTTQPPTTTTTTEPPTTTTTSTLVPAGLNALGGDGDGPNMPLLLLGGGLLLVGMIGLIGFAVVSHRGPSYGVTTPGMVVAWRRSREHRRLSKTSRGATSSGLARWWHTSGPVVSYREARASRYAAKVLRRQIEERRRLKQGRD